ncbi:MAG: RHS repeat-associated core domain-containing protein [Gaiellaceae bacterium]
MGSSTGCRLGRSALFVLVAVLIGPATAAAACVAPAPAEPAVVVAAADSCRPMAAGSFTGRAGGAAALEPVADAFERLSTQAETHSAGGQAGASAFSYVGLTDQIATETHTGSSTATKRYSYDASGSLTGMSSGGNDYSFSYGRDTQGSISPLVNQTGTVSPSYGYKPYGDSDPAVSRGDTSTSNPLNPNRYTGFRYDSGSGTLEMGARRFGPDVAHFLQSDIYEDALGDLSLSADPLSANRYSLAGGNPVSFVEVDGHVADETTNGTGSVTPNPNRAAGGARISRTWRDRTMSPRREYDAKDRSNRPVSQARRGIPPKRWTRGTREWWLWRNQTPAEETNDFDYVTGPAGIVRSGGRRAVSSFFRRLVGEGAEKTAKSADDFGRFAFNRQRRIERLATSGQPSGLGVRNFDVSDPAAAANRVAQSLTRGPKVTRTDPKAGVTVFGLPEGGQVVLRSPLASKSGLWAVDLYKYPGVSLVRTHFRQIP